MDEAATQVEQPNIRDGLTEDFTAVYANQCHFELSVWDLKMIFGQLDQTDRKMAIDWHTAVTVPWQVAKILSYLLRLNIAVYESNNGPIRIPEGSLPPGPVPPTGDQDTEQNRAFYEFMRKIHNQLAGNEKTL